MIRERQIYLVNVDLDNQNIYNLNGPDLRDNYINHKDFRGYCYIDDRISFAHIFRTPNFLVKDVVRKYFEFVRSKCYNHPMITNGINFKAVPIAIFPTYLFEYYQDVEKVFKGEGCNVIRMSIELAGGTVSKHHWDLWVSRLEASELLNKKPEDINGADMLNYVEKKVGGFYERRLIDAVQ